jgi:hypothetical protein
MLIEHISRIVCKQLEAKEDIGEKQSNEMFDELQRILELEQLLPLSPDNQPHQTYVGQEHAKFVSARMILKWGLREIIENFRNGRLSACSVRMITHLVRALFTDSPMRAKVIHELSGSKMQNDVFIS